MNTNRRGDDLRISSVTSEQIYTFVINLIPHKHGAEDIDRVAYVGFEYLKGNELIESDR